MSISHSLECRRAVRHMSVRHLNNGPTPVCQSGEWQTAIGNAHRALRVHTNICSHKRAVRGSRPCGRGRGMARPGAHANEARLGLL
jgi:hypothetical protein